MKRSGKKRLRDKLGGKLLDSTILSNKLFLRQYFCDRDLIVTCTSDESNPLWPALHYLLFIVTGVRDGTFINHCPCSPRNYILI